MIEFARQYGSYGYRRVAALLRNAGWQISKHRADGPAADYAPTIKPDQSDQATQSDATVA